MALFETMFDLTYLILVVSLGIRLLLVNDRGARLFGLMGVLLGSGDAFHLIPRVISHLSRGGFEAHAAALSWGEFVTSITMTIFYLLFYFYYKHLTGKGTRSKDLLVYSMVVLRILFTLLPQNGWGLAEGNYTFAILRNIPFAILGIALILWAWAERSTKGLKHMASLVFFSFLFYLPVVLFARFVPIVGALMIPKTVAYLLLVIVGFKNYKKEFTLQSIFEISFVSLVMGLAGGVFFREFTKFYNYSGATFLGKLHVHTLVLGFLSFFMIYLLVRGRESLTPALRLPIYTWTGGLLFSVIMMVFHGILEVVGGYYGTVPQAAISGLAGAGHIILALGMGWTILTLVKAEQTVPAAKQSVKAGKR